MGSLTKRNIKADITPTIVNTMKSKIYPPAPPFFKIIAAIGFPITYAAKPHDQE